MPTHWALTHITREWAAAAYHWFFMAQPYDFPERLLAGREEYYIRRKLDKPGVGTAGFTEAAMAEYIRCCTPENMMLWGEKSHVERNFEPVTAWSHYARAITAARKLPCGHYPAEQAPEETIEELLVFFKG